MIGADVRYIVRFAEQVPTNEWDANKKRIACFIANCWDLEDKYNSWEEIANLDADGLEVLLKEWDGDYETINIKGKNYIEMIKYEVYGSFLDTAEEMHSGMREFFPHIDYEFVCFVCGWGCAEEYVTIVVNGKRFDNKITFHETGEFLDAGYDEEEIEEILSKGGFEKPEPTEDNPYSVPGDILCGEDEYEYLDPINGFWK